jgi:hypothetical protein
MDGAVAHDPEDAPRGLVGLLVHAFVNEANHCGDTIWGLTTTEDLGAVEIPSRQVGPDAAAKILVFHYSACRSSLERFMSNGLFLGISGD